jgi:hypothetical protein
MAIATALKPFSVQRRVSQGECIRAEYRGCWGIFFEAAASKNWGCPKLESRGLKKDGQK